MIIQLADSVAENYPALEVEDKHLLEDLFISVAKGYHALLTSREMLNLIINDNALSNRCRGCAKYLYNTYSFSQSIARIGSVIKIEYNDGIEFRNSAQQVIQSNIRLDRESVLIGEDLNDISVFLIAAETKLIKSKIEGLRIAFVPHHGGGRRLLNVVQELTNRQAIGLCLIDCDTKCPNSISDNASEVISFCCRNQKQIYAVCLDAHEIENVLPQDILTNSIDNALSDIYKNICRLSEYIDPSVRYYSDIKSGTVLCDFLQCAEEHPSLNSSIKLQRWSEHVREYECEDCLIENRCKDHNEPFIVNRPCGERIVQQFLTFCDQHTYHKISEMIGDADHVFQNLGDIVILYCAGFKYQRL